MAKTKTRTKTEPKTRKRAAENPEQYKRFRDAAREYEADESSEAFEQAFRKIVPPRPHSK
jgi:hypothetical protein